MPSVRGSAARAPDPARLRNRSARFAVARYAEKLLVQDMIDPLLQIGPYRYGTANVSPVRI